MRYQRVEYIPLTRLRKDTIIITTTIIDTSTTATNLTKFYDNIIIALAVDSKINIH